MKSIGYLLLLGFSGFTAWADLSDPYADRVSFRGFVVVVSATEPNPRDIVQQAAASVFASGWEVTPLAFDGPQTYYIRKYGDPVPVPEVWALAARLRQSPRLTDVEADFLALEPQWADFTAGGLPARTNTLGFTKSAVASSGSADDDLPATAADYEWSIRKIRLPEAQQYAAGLSRPAHGEGILIGHPDTGYTEHPEVWDQPHRVLPGLGRNVWDGTANPLDPLTKDPVNIGNLGSLTRNPGHGTATSSVIISTPGAQTTGPAFVTGVASAARLIPIRTAPGVAVTNMALLAEAIDHARQQGAQVISISMGGIGSRLLQRAVRRATDAGIIVCAAAGNHVPFYKVVAPAAYTEVVGVAATNIEDRMWRGSSSGSAVAISAPGESVWRAYVRLEQGTPVMDVQRSSGTSYAVAHVAGSAAVWLAFHGPAELRRKYGNAVPLAFKAILQDPKYSDQPSTINWSSRQYGAGRLNLEKLLQAPLPDPASLRALPPPAAPRLLGDVPAELANVFRRRMQSALGLDAEPALEKFMLQNDDELRFHLYHNPEWSGLILDQNKSDPEAGSQLRQQLQQSGSRILRESIRP